MAWDKVREALPDAKGIAWDGCHKIYVLMDDEQMAQMKSYGYDPLLPVEDPDKALKTLQHWFEDSCALRFISAVSTNREDPNRGFQDLIAQFEGEED